MDVLYTLLFGLVGTGLMTFVLFVIGQFKVPNAEMVKGIGSAIPAPAGGSLVPGAMIHIAAGLVFAFVYAALGWELRYLDPAELLLLGAGVGIVRGVAVSIVLGLIAFDQQPLERMANVGFGVGLCHLLGNVLYGLCVSALFGFADIDFALAFF